MLASFRKPMKTVRVTPSTLLVVALLCVGVFMQMLGVPVTFWDLDVTVDVEDPSFLEGFALPTGCLVIREYDYLSRNLGRLMTLRSLLRDHSLFHPPTAPFSSRIG